VATQNPALLYPSTHTLAAIPPNNITNTVPVQVNEDPIKLAREDLLKYSSQQYDDYVKKISLKRPLNEKELKESKKQRRLIKNREYAQISRNKKKNRVRTTLWPNR